MSIEEEEDGADEVDPLNEIITTGETILQNKTNQWPQHFIQSKGSVRTKIDV